MLFEFLKKFFTWADAGPRKRPADLDYSEYSTPSKKSCLDINKVMNGREIIEIEDDDDDVQVCKEVHKPQMRHKSTGTIHKRGCKSFVVNGEYSNSSMIQPTIMSNMKCRGKSSLNCPSIKARMDSTFNRTCRLKEKELYGRMLQNFLPPKVPIPQKKSDTRKSQKPIEVIDIEAYKPSDFTLRTPQTYSTPKPKRWSTPLSKSAKSDTNSIKLLTEIIKLDDSDESPTTSERDLSKSGRIEELVDCQGEVVSTNTLRDKLAAKEVVKPDFTQRIADNYSGRIEQRTKEVEELQKITQVLAKRNRVNREVALEKQLAQSLRLCEPILEEDYEEEVELPELTPSMLQEVKRALNPHPQDEVLADAFGLRITRKDIHTLAGLNWLNDEVINFYMNLLIARGGKNKFPKVYAFNTFFYPKLLSGGHSALKRWTRKVDIFAHDLVAVPIHLGMHWCMAIIDFRDKSIRYYDSMGGENTKCLMALRKYLVDESLDKKKQSYDTKDWTLENMADIAQQMNGSDCGVFSCTFAEYICADKKLTFTQDHMPYFRGKMVYEILKVKLL